MLLLCFIHGFKGDTETFYEFPNDLKSLVREKLDVRIELAVYPKYDTRGDLEACTLNFREWLQARVIELAKETGTYLPEAVAKVAVVLVAHSMGGLLAADTLLSILDDQVPSSNPKEPLKDNEHQPQSNSNGELKSELSKGLESLSTPMFPLVKGVLTFDTPYNGLARSMFVYGAFSQYQKVSSIWNIMSAVSAGLMSGTALTRASSAMPGNRVPASGSNAWKFWQSIALRSGTAGAIAAGGAAAYMNRKKLMTGIKSLDKNSLGQGLTYGQDALGQGLAYINRESLGQGFAWVSSHLKFVGALMKQKQLRMRLQRLAAIEGIGICNLYASMGQNGYWSGGYFVPERTFCAVPSTDEKANKLFAREVNGLAEDEISAHVAMFQPEKNSGYEQMTKEARELIIQWYNDTTEPSDPLRPSEDEKAQKKQARKEKLENKKDNEGYSDVGDLSGVDEDVDTLDQSDADIAAAAAVPLPDDLLDEVTYSEADKDLQNGESTAKDQDPPLEPQGTLGHDTSSSEAKGLSRN